MKYQQHIYKEDYFKNPDYKNYIKSVGEQNKYA